MHVGLTTENNDNKNISVNFLICNFHTQYLQCLMNFTLQFYTRRNKKLVEPGFTQNMWKNKSVHCIHWTNNDFSTNVSISLGVPISLQYSQEGNASSPKILIHKLNVWMLNKKPPKTKQKTNPHPSPKKKPPHTQTGFDRRVEWNKTWMIWTVKNKPVILFYESVHLQMKINGTD